MQLHPETSSLLFGTNHRVGAQSSELASSSPKAKSTFSINLPNAITFGGYACAVGWLMGGPPVLALLSILADEIDGPVARTRGEATEYGALLDWAVDLTLAGAVAYKIDALPIMPAVTGIQVYRHERNDVVPFGSVRSVMMTWALLKGIR